MLVVHLESNGFPVNLPVRQVWFALSPWSRIGRLSEVAASLFNVRQPLSLFCFAFHMLRCCNGYKAPFLFHLGSCFVNWVVTLAAVACYSTSHLETLASLLRFTLKLCNSCVYFSRPTRFLTVPAIDCCCALQEICFAAFADALMSQRGISSGNMR